MMEVVIHLEFIALDAVKTRRIIISEIANENHSIQNMVVVYVQIGPRQYIIYTVFIRCMMR